MSIKILLADDSITIQKVIGIIFGGEDYSLTVVDNGKTAVDKALEIAPDILLIDALMPGMSGYEVCERIRSIPALAAKPILLLTGSFEPFDETKAKSCGADDFIAKPFESQQIISKVAELCERAAARAIETVPEAPAIAPEPAVPFMEQEPPPLAIQEPVAPPNDIWQAFTPDEPTPEPDFQPMAPLSAQPESEPSSSPWIPVDDQAFTFEEETVAEEPPSPFSQTDAPEIPSFGDFTFATEIEPEPVEPELEVPEPVEPEPVQPEAEVLPEALETLSDELYVSDEPSMSFAENPPEISVLQEPALAELVSPEEETVAPVAAVQVPATVTEDQLRAAIMGVSKDVIERIVWEVVPDLAEILIKEAIRRIKEGQ